MIVVWFVIGIATVGGAVLAVALASMRHWWAFAVFLCVYVAGVTAAAVQAVTTS